MRRRQGGMTTLGFIILLIPVAIVIYAGVRLTPIYLNYMNVNHALSLVASEVPNDSASVMLIQSSLSKHLDVSGVTFPDVKDFKVTRGDGVWSIEAAYDDQAPLFANVFILVSFDKTVRLKSGSVGD
jgi:uncharacterized protein DUF4845